MSLPPSILHIKRKRGSDEPPGTLQIESFEDHADDRQTKRRTTSLASEAWVFQRVQQDAIQPKKQAKKSSKASKPRENKIPEIKATQPGDELRAGAPTRTGILDAKRTSTHDAKDSILSAASSAAGNNTTDSRRRFHLARTTRSTQRPAKNGIRKSRAVATFKERNKKSTRGIEQQLLDEVETRGSFKMQEPAATSAKTDFQEPTQKKPGRNAGRISKQAGGRAKLDEGSEELAAQMQKFTLAIMAQDATQKQTPKSIPASPSKDLLDRQPRFRPKAPAQRFHERANDTVLSSQPSGDDDTDTDDEDDTITYTYVRVPAHTLQIVPTDMGVLVIENEEELEEFYEYGEDSSDDSDIFDEEIDENDEANPNNDYPDELDSEDEFNPNNFTGHASDDEDFDFDDANFSDDGNDLPWRQTAWGKEKMPAWEDDHEMSD